MDEKKRLIKNTGIIALGNISTKMIGFLLLPLYTSVLSTEEYGTIDYITTISMFLVPFISMLMDEAVFRFLIDCRNDEERKKILSLTTFILLISSSVFLIGITAILKLINYKYSLFLILYIIASLLTTMMNALLRGLGKIQLFAFYNFLISSFNITLNVVFIVVFNMGVYGMLLAFILSQAILFLVFTVWVKLWKYISIKGLQYEYAKQMIKYSVPLIPNRVSWLIINLSDRVMIMNMINSSASGLYAVSYKFPNLMDTVYGFFYQSWKESSARILQEGNEELFYNEVYKYLKKFMYSIVIGMTAFMPFVFKILVNEQYSEALNYVPILLLATYFTNISGFYGGIFTAYKDTNIMGITTLVAAVINFVLNLATICFWGLYAAAFSTLLANLVVYSYRKYKVKKYVKLNKNNKESLSAIGITMIILVLFYSADMRMQIIGAFLSLVYAVAENIEILKIFQKKFMCIVGRRADE